MGEESERSGPDERQTPPTVVPSALREQLQSPARILDLLQKVRRIAVVGLSPDPERASHEVARYLIGAGYEVIPVNPRASEILGRRSYPDLAAVPGPIDLVDVFRRVEDLPAVAREAVAAGARAIWFQLGLFHPEAVAIATRAGLEVVADRCTKIEHARFLGRPAETRPEEGPLTVRPSAPG